MFKCLKLHHLKHCQLPHEEQSYSIYTCVFREFFSLVFVFVLTVPFPTERSGLSICESTQDECVACLQAIHNASYESYHHGCD